MSLPFFLLFLVFIVEREEEEFNDVHSQSKRARSYQRRFLPKWMKIPEFSDWLLPFEKDRGRALCSICDKTVPAKIFDIRCHGNSKRHAKMATIRLAVLERGEQTIVMEHGEDHETKVVVHEEEDIEEGIECEEGEEEITIEHHPVGAEDEVEIRRALVAAANPLEEHAIHIVPIEEATELHPDDDHKSEHEENKKFFN
eukprot:TRINITY_DN1338_c0_g1_i6.p1 TRINITY_DN1338_c0_g1~~TRINITY_DN1338_c0_g1_i6.p1  ORF type:complete len:199 (-),score=45.66 TRINITY_DN1338_c0_g1_i6:157-753(-)